jgi:hypothetical protein
MVPVDDKVEERARNTRRKTRALIRRDTIVARIRSVHALSKRVKAEPAILPNFLVSTSDLAAMWTSFVAEDESVLDCLIALDAVTEYSVDLQSQVCELITDIKIVLNKWSPTEAVNGQISSNGGVTALTLSVDGGVKSRLPEIPLSCFKGDFHEWPMFHDRFVALMDKHSQLSNSDKMYYLLDCLSGAAAEAVKGIPISSDHYELAVKVLNERFDKPRVVATALIEKLLNITPIQHESLSELTNFVATFGESVALLTSLNIPDLGSFILFSLASRALPIGVQKLFEVENSDSFPSFQVFTQFLKSRISVLENVTDSRKPTYSGKVHVNNLSSLARKSDKGGAVSFTVNKISGAPLDKCKCCNNQMHSLSACKKFMSEEEEDRISFARTNRLCFLCLSDKHWANRCRSNTKCTVCSRKHHVLLHSDAVDKTSGDIDSQLSVSIPCGSTSLVGEHNSPSIILGTALVHIRDKSGTLQTVRTLVDSASQVARIVKFIPVFWLNPYCDSRRGYCPPLRPISLDNHYNRG